MKRLIYAAAIGLLGCGGPRQNDPAIKAERTITRPGGGGFVGQVGAGYQHGSQTEKYEGPMSKAPDWAKPTPAPKSK